MTLLPGETPIPVDAARWRDALPTGTWPDGFARRGSATRADVFAVADRWRDGSVPAVQLATAALAWGFGVRGYGRFRTGRVLDQDPDGARLAGALEYLRAEEIPPGVLVDAYVRFHTSHRLRGLGPAFFTKILYFAGYRRGRPGLQPLILDAVVARRLPEDAGPARKYTYGWTSSTWHTYLAWAEKQAARPEFAGEPDHVEIGLFTGSWRAALRSL
jgi:hypothetical protein